MIRFMNGRPWPYRIQLRHADDGSRRELVAWCRDNFPHDGNMRWVPPYRPDPRKLEWVDTSADDIWCFLREEDAVFFDLTWEGR